MNNVVTQEIQFAGKTITLETGRLAIRATAAVLARQGDTVVLVTIVEGGKSDLDYFPLQVEYIENLYSGGKIKSSRWVKRDGRPSDDSILSGRLIDRSIRPLFPKAFKNSVQIVITVLSVDGENEPDILAMNAVSAAIAISRIPWNGPIGAIRMGYKDGAYIFNPTTSQLKESELDLVVSQLTDKTDMIEAGASEVAESVVAQAVVEAHKETQAMIEGINEFVKKAGQEKLAVPEEGSLEAAKHIFEEKHMAEIEKMISLKAHQDTDAGMGDQLIDEVFAAMKEADPTSDVDKKIVAAALDKILYLKIRSNIITKKERPDGRKLDEIRPLTIEADVLPRTHGSAIFQRGLTQALTIVTLASPRQELTVETARGEEDKHYIHYYSGQPFSFGQVGRMGTPGRREIGHGALAERALTPVIPSLAEFPYMIMAVSEVLSQNGSTSMASTCGSTLALMAAGVPIKKPVAGISIGMMSDDTNYELLTDIIGLEDFSGDMDFKVAGTDTGITAIQLDVKTPGLTDEQVGKILERAKTARLFILDKIAAVIPGPRETVSEYAPKIRTISVPQDKIGEVIGPGGRVIKDIMARTQTQLDMEDDGTLTITGATNELVSQAVDMIQGMFRVVTPGEVFENAEVKRILPFGAFVEFLPAQEGMVHVSQMSDQFVNDPQEIVQVGDKVKVHVIEVDQQGRINLSMLFDENGAPIVKKAPERSGGSRPFTPRDGGDRGPRNFTPREGGRSFGDRPARSDHPLSQQLKRENGNNRDGNRGFKRNDNRY